MPIVSEPCSYCKGTGKSKLVTTAIAKGAMKRHLAHAYDKNVGANCNCPRVSVTHTFNCINCGGTGTEKREVDVPPIGAKVIVRDRTLLDDMGIPDFIGQPGTVLTYNDPTIKEAASEKIKELAITCNVTWQETGKSGKVLQKSIRANHGIETFGFLPRELRIVRS